MVKNIALLVVEFAFALELAEGVTRVAFDAPPRWISVHVNANADLTAFPLEEDGLTYRPPAGTRLRPNAHVKIINEPLTGRDIGIHTNALGYRNRELRDKTLTRVLFLGDSITFEDYAYEDETWVRRLEARSWETELPVEAINASKGGIQTSDQLAILEETGLSTRPDIVVLGFYLNDLVESYGFTVGRLTAATSRPLPLHGVRWRHPR